MTLQTFQTLASHGEPVAGHALGGTIEKLMRPGECAGGNLTMQTCWQAEAQ